MSGLSRPTLSLPLVGGGGEPVAFRQTLTSHGLAWLPPNEIDDDETALETTLLLENAGARRVRFTRGASATLDVDRSRSQDRRVGSRVARAHRAYHVLAR